MLRRRLPSVLYALSEALKSQMAFDFGPKPAQATTASRRTPAAAPSGPLQLPLALPATPAPAAPATPPASHARTAPATPPASPAPAASVSAAQAPAPGLSPAARGLHLEAVHVGGAHPHESHRWRHSGDGAGGKGLRILSLFSGVGGMDLGLHRALPHAQTVGMCEIDRYAQKVLNKAFPGVPVHNDVTELAALARAGRLPHQPNMVIGGFPCQDISAAQGANAQGLNGERSGLYREMRDIVEASTPDWVVFENVPLLRSRGMDVLLHDMASLGYEVSWDSISAASLGGPHVRDRVFVVAHRPGVKLDWKRPVRNHARYWTEPAPKLKAPRMHRKTRIAQMAAAGNAVVPHVAEHLGNIIANSTTGETPITGRPVARWDGGRWVSPKGATVALFPRAGLMRDGVVYSSKYTPLGADDYHNGDLVWVRNPSPHGDYNGGYTTSERAVLHHLTSGPKRLPASMAKDATALEEWGLLEAADDGMMQLTRIGEAIADNSPASGYSGEGGVDDAFVGRIVYIDKESDSVDIEMPDGDVDSFDREYITRLPTPAKSDWRGGFAEGRGNSPQQDGDIERRLKGRQLRHWVDGQVNPRFAEWQMGFPKGHLDAGQAPDDYQTA